jgi:HAD superfamily hydrolase (TIGR01509 family)
MIKLIIFDLDGVLIDTKMIHYKCLNESLEMIHPKYSISLADHLKIYDGLKTDQKLNLLTKNNNLPKELHHDIWKEKQNRTLSHFEDIKESKKLINLFKQLINDEYKIACCSNSIRKTVNTILSKLGIISYFDLILSNEDVSSSKPHPEIYWTAMSKLNVLPEETLIVEDSPNGLLAANRSNANIYRVDSSEDLTLNSLYNKLKYNKNMKNPKWKGESLNVLIPMAGAGSRFQNAGYTFPKPLIDVNGKPMIQLVVDNLNIDANYIYIVQKEHRQKYNLDTLLKLITPNCNIIEVDGLTEGAACTTLLAKELIDNDCPLLMANSDQYVEWDSSEFLYKMIEQNVDGGILTFKSSHPKWSFARVDEYNNVIEVAEKNPISDIATVGIYFWKKGSDYVKYANQMISKNIRTNNEFYTCPTFNEAILDNKIIKIHNIEKMWGIGTPEDLDFFIKNNEIKK